MDTFLGNDELGKEYGPQKMQGAMRVRKLLKCPY